MEAVATSVGTSPTPHADVALRLMLDADMSVPLLRRRGFRDVPHVVQTVAKLFKLASMELDMAELSPDLAKLVARSVAEKQRVVPAYASPEEITLATCDPTQIQFFDWIANELKRSVTVVLVSPGEVERAITRLYDGAAATAAPVIREDVSDEALQEATSIVDAMICAALDTNASDIHVEAGERETSVRLRVDGMLRYASHHPAEMHAAIVSRVKVLANLDIAQRHIPQDGRIKITARRRTVDLRVSILPTFYGEKVCCRILDNSRATLPLSALGFDEEELSVFERIIRVPYGLVLVTGPTGSGKSTTLYGALNAIRSDDINIVSVEDPVEYQLPGINQVQVQPRRGLTFATALRSILRQDPDVVLVGEIRDHETGVIASEAALTGHLVMASLHTNDAAGSITRLTEMGIESYLVAPALVGVVSQRLLRCVCDNCAESYRPGKEELEGLGLPSLPASVSFRRGSGCHQCSGTGHSGRIPVREILEVDSGLRSLISKGALTEEIRDHLARGGFRTMRLSALRQLFAGHTTVREVMRVTR